MKEGENMKRLVFKKWVNWLMVGVMVLAVMSLTVECESTMAFIVSKAVALGVVYVTGKLLAKFGRHEVL
jgi:hypothetical protein